MNHHEINFSPYANNILDFTERNDLITPKGERVSITNLYGRGFKIAIGEHEFMTQDNWEASFVLNSAQVGIND